MLATHAFQVINIHDCPTIYHVPLAMNKQGFLSVLFSKLSLGIEKPRRFLRNWKDLAERAENLRKVQNST
jgi:CTP synthase